MTDRPANRNKELIYSLSEENLPLSGWKLNLGCGRDIRDPSWGWINLDKYPMDERVYQWDILEGSLPFENDQFKMIMAISFFEHIPHYSPNVDGELMIALMNDLIRISEDGATWFIVTPSRAESLCAPEHTRLVLEGTFDPWIREQSSSEISLLCERGSLEITQVINFRQWTPNKYFGRTFGKLFRIKVVK